MKVLDIETVESLLSLSRKYQQLPVVGCPDSDLRRPTLEMDLGIVHGAVIAGFEKEMNDFPLYVCVCCERLHQRKSVSVISLSDDFKSKIWNELELYVSKRVLYMCSFCKRMTECQLVVSSMG